MTRFPSSDAVLERMQRLHPKVIDLQLDRMDRCLSAVGDPHLQQPPVIHVAGTNGKGSHQAYLRLHGTKRDARRSASQLGIIGS